MDEGSKEILTNYFIKKQLHQPIVDATLSVSHQGTAHKCIY